MTGNFTISIIGAGRLGGALAIALDRKGFVIENLAGRDAARVGEIAERLDSRPSIITTNDFSAVASDVILITTQDSEIENAAARLAQTLKSKPQVFHTSGALSSNILEPLKNIGCRVGSIHPLISVSNALTGADKLADAYFCVEGETEARATAEKIVGALGGKSFTVAAECKPLYHAAAVTACGHLVALVDAAIEMLTECGLDENEARQTLLPLIKSTVGNLENQTTAAALTGTFARADVATLAKHLDSLHAKIAPETIEIYLQMGARSLRLAQRQGADQTRLEKMERQILLAKKNLK